MLQSFLTESEDVDARFESMELTVGQALENLQTRFSEFLQGSGLVASGMSNVASVIDLVSENLKVLFDIATPVVALFTARVGLSLFRYLRELFPGLQ